MQKSWCQMNINNIINEVLFRYPLFGNIIVNLEIKHTSKNVPAPAFTDGKSIYYKDEFLTDFDDEEKVFIIVHEIFHIVLSHLFRNIGRDQDLLNYVEDAIINQLLIRDGLKMPKGLVYVEDALNYSVDELYMKMFPQINQIKEWMGRNTFHIDLSQVSEMTGQMMKDADAKDLQDLMSNNEKMRKELFDSYKMKLQFELEKSKPLKCGEHALGIEFPAVAVGTAKPLLKWQNILESNLKVPDDSSTCFYEVQMDGIIRKETKNEEIDSNSEIIIDSSGSMDMAKIRVILRECKNILLYSNIKVGFCDTKFYGWHDIRTNNDIDSLQIVGRGGTNFHVMADSFSSDSDNKIVITDGFSTFPTNRLDILWVIIGHEKPCFLDDYNRRYFFKDFDEKSIRYIFVEEDDILAREGAKKLSLVKRQNVENNF